MSSHESHSNSDNQGQQNQISNETQGDLARGEALRDREIEKVLTEVGKTLEGLQERYVQVQKDWNRQAELVEYKKELKQKKASNFEKEPIKTELRDIEKQLSDLEINLESVLLPDLFWQVVRFVGLGIVIGWLLKSIAG